MTPINTVPLHRLTFQARARVDRYVSPPSVLLTGVIIYLMVELTWAMHSSDISYDCSLNDEMYSLFKFIVKEGANHTLVELQCQDTWVKRLTSRGKNICQVSQMRIDWFTIYQNEMLAISAQCLFIYWLLNTFSPKLLSGHLQPGLWQSYLKTFELFIKCGSCNRSLFLHSCPYLETHTNTFYITSCHNITNQITTENHS